MSDAEHGMVHNISEDREIVHDSLDGERNSDSFVTIEEPFPDKESIRDFVQEEEPQTVGIAEILSTIVTFLRRPMH